MIDTIETRRLYVGNLQDDVTATALRAAFARHGAVADVYVAVDRQSGRSLRYAFVTMESAADARSAIAGLAGAMFEGAILTVSLASRRDQEDDGDGRHKKKTAAKPVVVVTSQFREAQNMTYELDCRGARLSIRVFPVDRRDDRWRLEASLIGGTPVASGVCATRALALEEIRQAWPPDGAAPVDWVEVAAALAGVRAI